MPNLHELVPWSRPSSVFARRGDDMGSSLATLQEEMNRLFDHFFTGSQVYMTDWDEKMIAAPAVNVVEDGNSFRVEADIAGIDPKEVNVEFANGCLTLKGERRKEEKKEDENYLRHEISYGSFLRNIALPETADGDKAKASFKNGSLIITVPKKAEALQKPKKIDIKTTA